MLPFRDSNKYFKSDGGILETMTIYDLNLSNSNPKDQKPLFEFGKEMNFNFRQKGRKSNRDKSLTKLLKPLAIMASGISTIFSPSDPEELCVRIKLLLQEKQAGIILI